LCNAVDCSAILLLSVRYYCFSSYRVVLPHSYNLVESFEEVANIDPAVVPLKTIYLEHNPVAKEFNYRKELKAIHKGLTQIDSTYVS
jgi:hypothetical protein